MDYSGCYVRRVPFTIAIEGLQVQDPGVRRGGRDPRCIVRVSPRYPGHVGAMPSDVLGDGVVFDVVPLLEYLRDPTIVVNVGVIVSDAGVYDGEDRITSRLGVPGLRGLDLR